MNYKHTYAKFTNFCRNWNNRTCRFNFAMSLVIAIIFIVSAFYCQPAFGQTGQEAIKNGPPIAPVRPVVDTLYGMKVVDRYRYMENLEDTTVQRWFKEQNSYTRSVLANIPGRDSLLADIKKYDKSVPARVSGVILLPGDLYFYEKTLPDQQVARLYMRHGLSGKEQILLDPAKYEKKGGPQWAISYYTPSYDGHYVAVGVSPGGSENATLHVIDTRTAKETGEEITRAQFNMIAWRHDNHSFFYNRLQKLSPNSPPTEKYQKSHIYLHEIGTDPEKDEMVFGYGVSPKVTISPDDFPIIFTSEKSSYAFGLIAHGVQNEITLYTAPLDEVGKPDTPWQKVTDVNDDVTNFAVHGDDLYLLTHKDAPRFKVIEVGLKNPDISKAKTIIPQSEKVIKQLASAEDALYVGELDGVVGQVYRIPYSTNSPEKINLPIQGTVEFSSSDNRIPGIIFDMTSWTQAEQIYSYDPKNNKVTNTGLRPLGPYDKAEDLTSEEVKVESYDGTMIPLSLIYKKGTKLDGSNPTILYGYGSYGITIYPGYDPVLLGWYDNGGIYAIAHVRGSGVYGEDWHNAGKELTKPNTWRDFIACAEYLIKHNYTSPSKLGIMGGSAGGITVGRAMTERPDLFAAVVDQVGSSNTLRSEFSPNGPPNIPEFGSVKTQAGFEDLYAMDSYQHVRDGVKYPAVLLTTGWNDPRVSPWQAGKMTARLQAATASGKPILLRVDYSGGHGYGSTKEQRDTERADEYGFLLWQFGVPSFQAAK